MYSSRVLFVAVGIASATMHARGGAAEQLQPTLLSVQQVGETTFFHVRLDLPARMRKLVIKPGPYGEWERRQLVLTPRLVPQDGNTSAVYQRLELPHFRPAVQFDPQPAQAPIEGLEFTGKLHGAGTARFLLVYPTTDKDEPPPGIKGKELAEALRPTRWQETPIQLNFAGAKRLPPGGGKETPNLALVWAQAQAGRLALLEALAPDFGFYGFACAATGRKYGVPDPVLEGERKKGEEHVHRRMLELTTGTMAITQALALKRLRGPGARVPLERTVEVAKVPGIDIAEHPWRKMMGGKKPAPEPLARLVPHDNYYIHFKSFAKFTAFEDFLEQWGTPAGRAYEVQSREYRLKERYERQLCLKSTWLGRQFGPYLIHSLAITGNDPYVREGSDVTILFHVKNRQGFLAGVEPFLAEARKQFAGRLKETKEVYQGISIESFVTPLREVSLHRAAFDDFVIYSNSPAGLRRVLDVRQGRLPSLWSSLDFQYMRTVFRADDNEEDGFAFLSDAFIRQLVGPASKIKELRRLEALTSLSMLTHGALFSAWETGKLPAGHQALLDNALLKQHHLYVPEGKEARWDAERQTAVADAYNTLGFATPLIELPIDKITPFEEQTYAEFRQEYLRLWQRFFDPVGVRFALDDKKIKLEVYILPMINNREYNDLRGLTGGKVTNLDVGSLSPRSLLQYTMSLRFFDHEGWALIRLDDSSKLARLGEWWILNDLVAKERRQHDDEALRLLFSLPLTVGAGNTTLLPGDRRFVIGVLESQNFGPSTVNKSAYKGTTITRIKYGANSGPVNIINAQAPAGKLKKVVIYHAVIGDGWYVGFDKGALHDLIDRALEHKHDKAAVVPINASLHLSPRSANEAGAALRQYLEWETHKRALPNDALWYVLFRAGILQDAMPDDVKREKALRFLGFIPVSPDESPYRYDPAHDEIVNERHGSLRLPRLHSTIAETSPLSDLLAQFPSLRVDLRFREDGFHSVVTVERKGK